MALLQGPVVFVDDEVDSVTTPAFQLARQIRDSGRPLAEYTELPPHEHVEHWRSIAFLVLDWDLVPTSPGGQGGSTLSEFARQELFDWLERFAADVYCPIFIVSAEDVNEIRRELAEHDQFEPLMEFGRIAVFSKQTIMDRFIEYVEEWVSSKPALVALNVWANEFEQATDRLWHDMEGLAPDWPAYVWSMAEADGVDPSYELASVLSANLMHRINPLSFEEGTIKRFSGSPIAATARRVSFGRTTLVEQRLYPGVVLPGDIFADPNDEDCVWINLTPACHTVLNRPPTTGDAPDPDGVLLHLVRGRRHDHPGTKSAFGKLKGMDGPNSFVVHALLGDDPSPYVFDFKVRQIARWGEVGSRRTARLLPPYVTAMQQRHAAFLMNEGLPRVEFGLYNDQPG